MSFDYTALLTGGYRDKPRMVAAVALLGSAFSELSDTLAAMTPAHHLDTAVGEQLDTLGIWIGGSRRLPVAISGSYFSFDVSGLGFDEGYWKPSGVSVEGQVVLDDSTYREVLRLLVAKNNWEGRQLDYTNYTASFSFGDVLFRVHDLQNMTATVTVSGAVVPSFLRVVIQSLELVPKPMGVEYVAYNYTSAPVLFATVWDDTQRWWDFMVWEDTL